MKKSVFIIILLFILTLFCTVAVLGYNAYMETNPCGFCTMQPNQTNIDCGETNTANSVAYK
jgi:hypothetical protein